MSTQPQEPANAHPAHVEIPCAVTKVRRADALTQWGETNEELCVVLKLPGDDRDVSARIGSSPDRPATPPAREEAVLLLRTTTTANVDDTVEVAGLRLTVKAISPSYDSVGKLAYHVVQATICATGPEARGGE